MSFIDDNTAEIVEIKLILMKHFEGWTIEVDNALNADYLTLKYTIIDGEYKYYLYVRAAFISQFLLKGTGFCSNFKKLVIQPIFAINHCTKLLVMKDGTLQPCLFQ